MPLIFTSNEVKVQDVFDWKDITGVQYHYPNGYLNKVITGERFIYYRGTRRAGNTRGIPEYFGTGIIGEVWRDEAIPTTAPKAQWQWYCTIAQYTPFHPPVPFKVNGIPYEEIPQNLWGVGIRSISEETYQKILSAAGLSYETDEKALQEPEISSVQVQEGICLIPRISRGQATSANGKGRYSKRAKQIGDRAEEIVYEWIKQNIPCNALRWVANEGVTPGWDIEYIDETGKFIAVEVKASTGKAFLDFEVTLNELEAARRLGAQYWFYLVTDCFGKSPVIQKLSGLELEGRLNIEPIRWRLSLNGNYA